MNFTQTLKRMTVGLMWMALPILGGCSGNTQTWSEEVKLLDGRVITITQKRRYENVYDGQGSGNLPREFWVSFKLPEFGDQEITWHENLMPRVLNVSQGSLYLVGIPWTELEFRQYGNPKPSYVGYRYESDNWVRIPFLEIPDAIYNTNLLIAAELPQRGKHVSLGQKAEELANDRLRDVQKKIDPKYVALNY